MPTTVENITEAQAAVLRALTDQRCSNLLEVADVWADLPEATKRFLKEADPKTLNFLRLTREYEIDEWEQGIQLVRSLKITGRMTRRAFVILFGTFMGFLLFWEKIQAMFERIGK